MIPRPDTTVTTATLDPMAGFSGTRGAYFFDYAKEEGLIFMIGRRSIGEIAGARPRTHALLNIGYIRSPRFEEHTLRRSVADLTGSSAAP